MPADHYENFPVASLLLPTHLRQPVLAIYRFARAADDVADEGTADARNRLAMLARFEAELDRLDAARTPDAARARADLDRVERTASSIPHATRTRADTDTGADTNANADTHADTVDLTAIFAPLATVVVRHRLPLAPLRRLLSAFAQDVRVKRYADFAQLRDYCRRSADPVGELMLHLYGAATPENLALSDAICTGLQLTNFWQDVAVDWAKGRVYIPQDDLARHGVAESDIAAQRCGPAWRALMAFEVGRARALLHSGAPLALALPGRIGWELRLVVQGGLRILECLEARGFDMFRARPALDKAQWLLLAWRALLMPHATHASHSHHDA